LNYKRRPLTTFLPKIKDFILAPYFGFLKRTEGRRVRSRVSGFYDPSLRLYIAAVLGCILAVKT